MKPVLTVRRSSLALMASLVLNPGGAATQPVVSNAPPVTLTVLPKETGGHRTESHVNETKISMVLRPIAQKSTPEASTSPIDTKIEVVEGTTYDDRIDAVSADGVSFTRRMVRWVAGGSFSKDTGITERRPLLDTNDPQVRRAAESDPKMSVALHTLEIIEMNADGSMRRYKANGPNAAINSALQTIAEHRMENGEALLPDHPVRINETWPMGTLENADPRFGRLTRDIEGKLVSVVTGGLPGLAPNEMAAVIEVRGTNLQHRFDEDSQIKRVGATSRVAAYEEKGTIVYSIERREVVTDTRRFVGTIEIFVPADKPDAKVSGITMTVVYDLRASGGRGTIEQVRTNLGLAPLSGARNK